MIWFIFCWFLVFYFGSIKQFYFQCCQPTNVRHVKLETTGVDIHVVCVFPMQEAFVELYDRQRDSVFSCSWPSIKTVFGMAALGAASLTIGAYLAQKWSGLQPPRPFSSPCFLFSIRLCFVPRLSPPKDSSDPLREKPADFSFPKLLLFKGPLPSLGPTCQNRGESKSSWSKVMCGQEENWTDRESQKVNWREWVYFFVLLMFSCSACLFFYVKHGCWVLE